MRDLAGPKAVAAGAELGGDAGAPAGPTLVGLLAIARRQRLPLLLAPAVTLLGGALHLATAVPHYTATASLILDPPSNRAVKDAAGLTEVALDHMAVDSQVEILRSERIALAVAERLKLADDPALAAPGQGLAALLRGAARALRPVAEALGGGLMPDPAARAEGAAGEPAARRRLIEALAERTTVRRRGRTSVLDISVRWRDGARAAEIANALARAYLDDQLDAKFEATRRAGDWLQQRIGELKRKSVASDLAVQRFRAEKGLIAADGKLVNEQQLKEINSELATARSESARARARHARIEAIITAGDTGAAVSEALGNEVITRLRDRYFDVAKRAAELAGRLGEGHAAVAGLRGEMADYQRLIFEELGRIAASYLSEVRISEAREAELARTLAGILGQNALDNETLVALRELEREAESYRTLYQAFLQRFQEASQQQSFPLSQARIISPAAEPLRPSDPRPSVVLGLALALGAAAGAGVGAWRELSDRSFRTGAQVEAVLKLDVLGMLPAVAPAATSPGEAAGRAGAAALMGHALDAPLSPFAETLRSIKVAADRAIADKPCRILALISAQPGEGKSTVSKNLASLLAHLGHRTLLIDADLRGRGLTRALAPRAAGGLVEVLAFGAPLESVLLAEPRSGLRLLPAAGGRHRRGEIGDLLATPRMAELLAQAARDHHYIVLDLAPLGPVVDARTVAPLVDGFVFVAAWGETARAACLASLRANEIVWLRTIGAVLNKVDRARLPLYRDLGATEHDYARYAGYEGG